MEFWDSLLYFNLVNNSYNIVAPFYSKLVKLVFGDELKK